MTTYTNHEPSTRHHARIFFLALGAFALLPSILDSREEALQETKLWHLLWIGIWFLFLKSRKKVWGQFLRAQLPTKSFIFFLTATLLAYSISALDLFRAFIINGIDFSIFDYALFYTRQGSFMWSPFCECSQFGIHAFHILLPFVPLHALLNTPHFLLLVYPFILWSSGLFAYFIGKEYMGKTVATGIFVYAVLFNGWMTSTLNYSFHPEGFYIPLGLWMISAWILRRPWQFWVSTILFLSIKEDGAFYCAAFALGLFLFEKNRRRESCALLLLSLCVAALNFYVTLPYFRGLTGAREADLTFLSFWSKYGSSFYDIILNIFTNPLTPLLDILKSHWYVLFGSALFLPVLGRAYFVALIPAVIILGTSQTAPMRSFGLYYAAPLLPFFFVALLEGLRVIKMRVPRLDQVAVAVIAFLFLSVSKGSSVRFYDTSRFEGITEDLEFIMHEIKSLDVTIICMQAALIPHARYDHRIRPISMDCLQADASIGVINFNINTYPYSEEQLRTMIGEQRPLKFFESQTIMIGR